MVFKEPEITSQANKYDRCFYGVYSLESYLRNKRQNW